MNIAKFIDHTALKPNVTRREIETLCAEAKEHGFASVCVNPTWVKLASELLAGSDVLVCTVIGFPLGANTPEVKAFEAGNAIASGAGEVDMVINVAALIDRNLELVKRDVSAVVDVAKGQACTKVIIETALLSDEEKILACRIAMEAGADFVKTSTGFSGGGATVSDIRLMRETVGPDLGVKASGGVRTATDAQNLIEAGATRIGASAGVDIVKGLVGSSDY